MPIRSQVAFEPSAETREGSLRGSKRRGVVLPLGLGEWRCDGLRGGLERTDAGLQLRQSGMGTCLFAPLFFNLDRDSFKKDYTWRQLTVAEQRVNLPRDVAVGYRVQFGKTQWLIYRSLMGQAGRTVLGQNISTELLISRFKTTGQIETLLDIEYSPEGS